jgi:hypothetical protein
MKTLAAFVFGASIVVIVPIALIPSLETRKEVGLVIGTLAWAVVMTTSCLVTMGAIKVGGGDE